MLRFRLATASLLVALATLTGCSLALDFDATSSEPLGNTGQAFCAQHAGPPAIFCDDFDAELLGVKWPAVEQTNGSARNDQGAAVSGTSSFLSIANPVGVGGGVRAVSTLGFASLKSTKVGLRISFDLRVDDFDRTSGAKNIAFDFLYGPLADFNQIVLNLVSTETAVSVQIAENAQTAGSMMSQYMQHGPFTAKPTIGQWMKVEIDLDIINPVGTGNYIRVRLDGVNQLETQLSLALKGDVPRIELGVGWVDSAKATQAWAVRYDNFLVESVML